MQWLRQLTVVVGVLLAHAGVLVLVLSPHQPQLSRVEPPRISGVFIQAPPAELVQKPSSKQPSSQPVKQPTPISKPKTDPILRPKPDARPAPVVTEIDNPAPDAAEPDIVEPVSQPPEPSPVQVESEHDESLGAPITPPRIDAYHHSNADPAYPSSSRRRGEEGAVILELVVLADGTVGDIKVKVSSGHPRLDRSALKAVKTWRYTPAQQDGKPVDYRYLQPITFSLHER